jgi:hypothetical protein
MRHRLVPVLAAAALVVAACGNGADDTADPGTTTTTTTEPAPEPDPPEPWEACENEEAGFRVEHPPGWWTNDHGDDPGHDLGPCALFHPEEVEVPTDSEIPLDTAVIISVDPVTLAEAAADPFEEELERREATVDGRDALRVELEGSGEAFLPEGVAATRWLVDLGDRTLTAVTYDIGEPPYPETQDVLDDMVETIRFEDDAVTEPPDPDPEPPRGPEGPEPVGEASTDTKQSDDFPGGFGDTAFLVDLRASRQAGFDRIVLELDGDEPPSYRVSYVEPPIREDASGYEVEIDGVAFLELRLEPASRVDLSGPELREVYDGPDEVPVANGQVAREVVLTGDFESNMAWVVGLDRQAPFAVAFFEDPLRLVVDILHG